MNTLRNLLLSIAVILGAGLIAADHFIVNSYVGEFVEARNYNNAEVAKILAAEDSARLADNLAVVTRLQGIRVSELELKIRDLVAIIETLKGEIAKRDAVISEFAKQIDKVSKDTTILQKENDVMDYELRVTKKRLAAAVTELDNAKKTVTKLTLELKTTLDILRKTEADLNIAREQLKKAGIKVEVAPTPAPKKTDPI